MDALPDALVQCIVSCLQNAKDIACCTCVSRQWKESIPFVRRLYFSRSSFEGKRTDPNAIVGRMIASAVCLEELIIYCPFSPANLASWLLNKGPSLRHLDLRLDSLTENRFTFGGPVKLDCIGSAKGLETLKLWGVDMTQSPDWGTFEKLHALEIVGMRSNDHAILNALKACPNLTKLTLFGCDGVQSISIQSKKLEQCRLDFYGPGDCSLTLSSPRLQLLEIQGCSWIHVQDGRCLQNLTIGNNAGKVFKVDVGKLESLDYLSISGLQWCWDAVSSVLESASEVKHLVMKIEFCGDFVDPQPFPRIDMVEFFNSHPKLRSFEIHGAMFAAFCLNNSSVLDSRFTIPCLEEILIKVRSPLNAEEKVSTLEALVKFSRKLQKMVIRVTGMKNCLSTSDKFFKEICNFVCKNRNIVRIE